MGPQDYYAATNTTSIQAGGLGFGESIAAGGTAALISGISSIYNTGVDIANYFGADADRWKTVDTLNNIDRDWGKFYQENQSVIDAIGFVGTSFIPGGLAIKGLKLLREGEAVGAFGRALGYASSKQTANLEKAMQTLGSAEGSVFSKLNKNYIGALAWGTADQTLQMAAFEIGVVATMKASPLLEGQDWKDMTYDVIRNAAVGGAIGGAIEGFLMNGIIKGAARTISGKDSKYQNLQKALDRTSLTESDKVYTLADNVLALPKEVFENDKVLDYAYRLGGKTRTVALDTTAHIDNSLATTVKNGMLTIEEGINKNISTIPDSGFAQAMVRLVKAGRDNGAVENDTRQRLGDYLWNLESIKPAVASIEQPTGIFYFNKAAKLTEFPLTAERITDQAYKLPGRVEDLKVALLGQDATTVEGAWKAGYDLTMKNNGSWSINPALKTTLPKRSSLLMDLRTGATGDKATLTIADLGTAEQPLRTVGDTVSAGGTTFRFDIANPTVEGPTEATARHLWASGLKKVEGAVSVDDFAVLDRMSTAKQIVDDSTMLKLIDGSEVNWREMGNFDNFVFENKVRALKDLLDKGPIDISATAYKLNVEPWWIENVIASKFDTGLHAMASGAPDLREGWQRSLASYGDRDHVLLSYKPQNIIEGEDGSRMVPLLLADGTVGKVSEDAMNFVTGTQAYNYRVKLATDQLDTAFAAVMGEDAAHWSAWNYDALHGKADVLGSGPGLLSFANADYGDVLRLAAQDSGKHVHTMIQKLSNLSHGRMQPFYAKLLQSPKDAAELTAVVTKMRRSGEHYRLLGTEHGLDGAYLVADDLVKAGDSETMAAILAAAQTRTQGSLKAVRIESPLVANMLKEHMALNAENLEKRQVLWNAQGMTSNLRSDLLYVPPIDTRKVPYFAFVRPYEGKIFGDSSVSMITAKTPEELQRLAAQIDKNQFDVIYKHDTERFFKAKGDYDYSRAMNQSTVNSELKKAGRLGDFMPSFESKDVLEDFINFHQRQATQLVRDAVSTKYAQTFTELRRLSEASSAAATSKMSYVGKFLSKQAVDPYDDYIKTALDISKRSEFTILHQTNEFVDALGTRAYQAVDAAFRDAKAGKIGWEEANNLLERYGLGTPYKTEHAFEVAQTVGDRNLVRGAIQKANMLLANVVLRFDFANSIINTISTPILLGSEMSAIRNSIKDNPELVGKLAELTSVQVPGQNFAVPSTTRLLYNAVKNFWGPNKAALLKRYQDNGDIKNALSLYHEMIDHVSITHIPGQFSKNVDKAVEMAATFTGNNFAEQFTRFVSADVMRQLTDPLVAAGRMGTAEQNSFISVFVNRVQGNYITSQRPILFQGTLGAAVGLFQTYQLNLMQQLFRHIENRNTRAVAAMAGMQTAVFGLNGIPMFEAINTNLIGNANMNPGHKDIYSTVTQAVGKTMGDWLLYGTASAFPIFGGKGPALYTRGDLQPRHPSIIPISPLDVPAVDGSIRFVTNLWNTAQKINNGGALGTSLLEGLEHNSLSRPLAGIAQAMLGYSTTSKGSLIAANNDLFSIANASRVLGAKPLDESVALNTLYRINSYKARDRDRIEKLGEAVKTKLRRGEAPTDEEFETFAGKYAASGGRVERFSQAMQSWSKDANESVLNKLQQQVNSPYGQRFMEVMGGSRAASLYDDPDPSE